MDILFISTWFPYPPDNGSRIRIYNLLRALSREHTVHLISLLQDDSNPNNAQPLHDICRVVSVHKSRWFKPGTFKSFAGLFSSRPRSVVDTYLPEVASAVKRAIEDIRPDVIIASQIGAAEYVPSGTGIPVIIEEIELSNMWRRMETLNGLRHLRTSLTLGKHISYIRRLLQRCTVYTCVSENEQNLIQLNCSPQARGFVIPNGVDVKHYHQADRQPDEATLIYNGAITYSANLDAVNYFAHDIYPILSMAVPNIKLRVTGRTDGVDTSGLSKCPGIDLVGYIDDIRDILRTSAVCVVPLREGGGSRLKILEAMAAGVPVVSTSMGAEGIKAVHGTHILIADTPAEFSAAVEKLLIDSDLAQTLTKNAIRLVTEQYDWHAISAEFEHIIGLNVSSVKTSGCN
ncbi:glycosyltransferase family 4 protein [bacterium]|nr:glycosyltransferase family 4 protein [bacterium]